MSLQRAKIVGHEEAAGEGIFSMTLKTGDRLARPIIPDGRVICSGLILLACSGAAALAFPPLLTATAPLPIVVGQRAEQSSLILAQAAESADFHAYDVSGPAGRPLPFKIEFVEDGNQTGGQLFIFTGLPPGVTLSPGGNFGDFWAVNAGVIKDLTLTAPKDFSGSFKIWITRSRSQSATAHSDSINVTINRPAGAPAAATAAPLVAPATMPTAAAAPTFPEAREPAPARSKGPPANEQMLMTRANESFKKGDVSGARVIYEYLAMQGSAVAAMAMGESYDPQVLSKLVVKGLDPDAKKARQWYEKAEQLGNMDARSRLNALAAR
jgi:hypothetical protein